MAKIIDINSWWVHIAKNEWEALCGEPNPELLVESTDPRSVQYRLCSACKVAIDKRS